MNHHPVVLQERIQTPPVFRRQRDAFKGVGRKIDQEKKKNEDDKHDRHRIGNHSKVFFPVLETNHEHVCAEKQGPKKKGTFLSAPKRGDFIKRVELNVGVGPDILQTEVIGEKSPPQTYGRNGNAHPYNKWSFVRTKIKVDAVSTG